jgi:cobalamin biosynthetic protein CobC
MLEHGGRLRAAAQQHNIPLADWLDLSAAINPVAYPVGDIPTNAWQRLPEDDDELAAVATAYYGHSLLLPVAGSQAAIQSLPFLVTGSALRVGVLQPTYNEHPHAWQQAGHTVIACAPDAIDAQLGTLDALVLANPNNPTGSTFSADTLLRWHTTLQQRNGWLVVDEAFLDADPAASLVPHTGLPGLVVLRSLGKFFGLAGARVGFVFAQAALLDALRERLGPWPLSHPSRLAASRALADSAWQQQQRCLLPQQSARLARLLTLHGLPPTGGCALFQWVLTPQAALLHRELAAQGILARLYSEPASLRFGLPADEAAWQRLALALATLVG